MPQLKLDHCVIHVSDWERSNAFYRDVLGAQLIPQGDGWAYRFGDTQLNCHGPGHRPELVARVPVQPGNSDLCFEWRGPIAEAQSHLEKHGVVIEVGRCRAMRRAATASASISAIRTDRCWSSSRTRRIPERDHSAARVPHGASRRWRSVDAGYLTSIAAGRIGLATRLPPQLGQLPPNTFSAQAAQNVHSNVQMRASALSGGRSRSQHSQLGFSWSMALRSFDTHAC